MAACLNNTDEVVLFIYKPMLTWVFIAKEKKTISVLESRKGIVKITLCSSVSDNILLKLWPLQIPKYLLF